MKRFLVTIIFLVLAVLALWAIFSPGFQTISKGGAKPTAAKPTAPAKPVETGPKTDGKMTNAPSAGGTVIIDLPPAGEGDTLSLVGDDELFEINADGDLARTYKGMPTPGVKSVTVRATKPDGSTVDKTYTVNVTIADWTLDAFPEMVIQSLQQESVPQPGPVAQVAFGGVTALAGKQVTATAPAGFEPVKLDGNRGIEFAADKGQRLTFAKNGDALLQYRWTVVIFRVEPGTGTGSTASLVCINDGPNPNGRSGNWMPLLQFNKDDNSVTAIYRGYEKQQLKSPANSVSADGKWNVALAYRRYGQLYLRVNGQDSGESPTDSFSAATPQDITESRIGNVKTDAPGWALDSLWLGQSELSERVADKMEAWALTRAAGLPGGAAAAAAFKPVVDAEDFPHRYTFDAKRFAAWRAAQTKDRRSAFMGQPVDKVQPDRSNWVRVFLDDFRKPAVVGASSIGGSSVGDSTFDKDAGKQIWYAPGTNTAVGGRAYSKDGSERPWKDAYVLDPVAQTLTMRLYCFSPGKDGKDGRWASSQFTSVTSAGLGYSWAGPKGFRVRVKVGPEVPPGLFPCPMWFYGIDHLFWRTGERIEFDIIELDDNWDNYGGTHVHNGSYKGLFGHSAIDTMNKKEAPDEIKSIKLAAGKNVAGFNAWDGNWHVWEVWIDEKTTYINCDGVEIARADTNQEYLERLYMFVDTSLKEEKLPDGTMGLLGMDETKSYDMVVDYIEGFAPPEVVNATPGAPFTARPTLEGSGAVGTQVTCTANVEGVKDVWYYWHSGGYPRGYSRSNTYTILPEDKGAEIRCMVKAVGAKDQPESWTAPLVAQ